MAKVRIAIANDHAGIELKNVIKEHLIKSGYDLTDFGTNDGGSVDYPDFAYPVCAGVLKDNIKGILICGTGIGMSMAANKVRGIRAALCLNEFMAQVTRQHNDANILCLGSRVTDEATALKMVDLFLNTGFEGGRHGQRVAKLMSLENK